MTPSTTTYKLGQVVVVEKQIVSKVLGMLRSDDLERVTDTIRGVFGLS